MTEKIHSISQMLGSLQASLKGYENETKVMRETVAIFSRDVTDVKGQIIGLRKDIATALAQEKRVQELEKENKKLWRYAYIAVGFVLAINIGINVAAAGGYTTPILNKQEYSYEREAPGR